MHRLLVFGYGYTAQALCVRLGAGWRIAATSRDPRTRASGSQVGIDALDPASPGPLQSALAEADAVLICAPPGADGCPGLRVLTPLWRPAHAPWVGYLSTTGVYGDRGGGWVREDTPTAPKAPEAIRRVDAEVGWRDFADAHGAPLALFRLPGIYGPGRSALDRVRVGEVKRWVKPGQVFSRIHVDDLADALVSALGLAFSSASGKGASGKGASPQGVFHLCDDEPAAAADVTAFACRLLGREPPPEVPLDLDSLSPMARRFWSESKRVSNARAKAALGWRPAHSTYREGLKALLQRTDRREPIPPAPS